VGGKEQLLTCPPAVKKRPRAGGRRERTLWAGVRSCKPYRQRRERRETDGWKAGGRMPGAVIIEDPGGSVRSGGVKAARFPNGLGQGYKTPGTNAKADNNQTIFG